MSLVEVVISLAIGTMSIGAMATTYYLSTRSLQFVICSSAADQLARQRVEQTFGAKWDPYGGELGDELVSSNFPPEVESLNVPTVGATAQYATNVTTITIVSTDPPMKMVRVDCIWSDMDRGPYTNTFTTYRSPDQ